MLMLFIYNQRGFIYPILYNYVHAMCSSLQVQHVLCGGYHSSRVLRLIVSGQLRIQFNPIIQGSWPLFLQERSALSREVEMALLLQVHQTGFLLTR